MTLRYKDIGEIISLIDASSCDEFVLETDEVKLVLRRRSAGAAPAAGAPAPAAAPAPSNAAGRASTPAPQPSTSAQGGKAAPTPGGRSDAPGVVNSPMVGTFYRAPSPSEPAFVEVGSKVEAGDPLGIIEVMKLFTTIHAEFAGTVREVGAENAQLVEYGQMLFVIEPA